MKFIIIFNIKICLKVLKTHGRSTSANFSISSENSEEIESIDVLLENKEKENFKISSNLTFGIDSLFPESVGSWDAKLQMRPLLDQTKRVSEIFSIEYRTLPIIVKVVKSIMNFLKSFIMPNYYYRL